MQFEPYKSIGEEEKAAVMRVMDSGCLSGFVAGPPDVRDQGVNGGPEVQALEEQWKKKYGVKHAITFNSATTALMAACGAAEVRPGDHVICPPWTMSATVAAAKFYGAVIDFADIEEDYFCINPDAVESIKTIPKAVMAVNLFGQPCDLHRLREYCDKNGSILIEDCAQAPYAWMHDKLAGTIGHIGVYSLNRHKHIHCGEGGVAVTNDDELARKMRSIRNHGIDPLGLNLRMTELQAAIARVQVKNMPFHIGARKRLAKILTDGLREYMDVPKIRWTCTHNYYLWVTKQPLDGLKVPHIRGYIQPLHKIFTGGEADCPVTERLRETVTCFEICKYNIQDVKPVIGAFREAIR